MPIVARRPSAFLDDAGRCVLATAEPSPTHLPAWDATAIAPAGARGIPTALRCDEVLPLGTVVARAQPADPTRVAAPFPVVLLDRDAERGTLPARCRALREAVDLCVWWHAPTQTVHAVWWWNAWSPDYADPYVDPSPPPAPPPAPPVPPTPFSFPPRTPPGPPAQAASPPVPTSDRTVRLPRPPRGWQGVHGCPDPGHPAWLGSLCPNVAPGPFDPRRPFWVAPLPEAYAYDLFPGQADPQPEGSASANPFPPVRGSRPGAFRATPDSPGARWLRDMAARKLVEFPGPEPGPFNLRPSIRREDWERRGGVVAAGAHVLAASLRDAPRFVSAPKDTSDAESLPGRDTPIPEACTWADHLLLVNALKAHRDHAGLLGTTRVLMRAEGWLADLVVRPRSTRFRWRRADGGPELEGAEWPAYPTGRGAPDQRFRATAIVLRPPAVVGAFPSRTNYRLTANPTTVFYPAMGYPDSGHRSDHSGLLQAVSTARETDDPACNWLLHDPEGAFAAAEEAFRGNYDRLSQ